MIYLYSGTPGSGKSLHVAELLYRRLRACKPCICNFAFDVARVQGKRKRKIGEFVEVSNDQLTPRFLFAFSEQYFEGGHRFKEETITLVLDEAQLLFNSRDWNMKGRMEWLSFFTQHRKYGYQVILVAQFDRMLDRQIRSVIEYEYIHRKVSNFGIWGKLFSVFAAGKMFCSVKMWYPLRERIGADWFVAKPKYYKLYDTYKKFGADLAAASSDQRGSVAS